MLYFDIEILSSVNLACKDPKIKLFHPCDAADPFFQSSVKKNSPSAIWNEKTHLQFMPPAPPPPLVPPPHPDAFEQDGVSRKKNQEGHGEDDYEEEEDGLESSKEDDLFVLRIGVFDCRGGNDVVFVGNMFVDLRTGAQVGDGAPQHSLSGNALKGPSSSTLRSDDDPQPKEAPKSAQQEGSRSSLMQMNQRNVLHLTLLAGTLQLAVTRAAPPSPPPPIQQQLSQVSKPQQLSAAALLQPAAALSLLPVSAPAPGARSSVSAAVVVNNAVNATHGVQSSPSSALIGEPAPRIIIITLKRIVMTSSGGGPAHSHEVIARVVYPGAPTDGNDVLCGVNESIHFSLPLAPLGSNTSCLISLWPPRQRGGGATRASSASSPVNLLQNASFGGSSSMGGPIATLSVDMTKAGSFVLYDDASLDPVISIEGAVEHVASATAPSVRQSSTKPPAQTASNVAMSLAKLPASLAPHPPGSAGSTAVAQLYLLVETLEVHTRRAQEEEEDAGATHAEDVLAPAPGAKMKADGADAELEDTSRPYAVQWRAVLSLSWPSSTTRFVTSTRCPMAEAVNRRAFICAQVNELFVVDIPAAILAAGFLSISSSPSLQLSISVERRNADVSGANDSGAHWISLYTTPVSICLDQEIRQLLATTGTDNSSSLAAMHPLKIEASLTPVSKLKKHDEKLEQPKKKLGSEGHHQDDRVSCLVELQVGIVAPAVLPHFQSPAVVVPMPQNDRSRSLCAPSARLAISGQQCTVQLLARLVVLSPSVVLDLASNASHPPLVVSGLALALTGISLRGMQTAVIPTPFPVWGPRSQGSSSGWVMMPMCVAEMQHTFIFTLSPAARIVMLSLLAKTASSSLQDTDDQQLELLAQAEFCPYDHLPAAKAFFPLLRFGEPIGLVLLEWTSNFYASLLPSHSYSRVPSLRSWERVDITVMEARELVVADLGGMCNAYVVVQRLPLDPNTSNMKFITPTIKQSKNPSWVGSAALNQVTYPIVAGETQGFVFLVLDDDAVGTDNFLGMCMLQSDAPHWIDTDGDCWLPLQPKEVLLAKLSGSGSASSGDYLDRSGLGSLRIRWRFHSAPDDLSAAPLPNPRATTTTTTTNPPSQDYQKDHQSSMKAVIASGALSVVLSDCIVKHLPPLSMLRLPNQVPVLSMLAPPVFYLQIVINGEVVSEVQQKQINTLQAHESPGRSPAQKSAAAASIAAARQFTAEFGGDLILRGVALAKYVATASTISEGSECSVRLGFYSHASSDRSSTAACASRIQEDSSFFTVCSKAIPLNRLSFFASSPSGFAQEEALELEVCDCSGDKSRIAVSPSLLTYNRRVVEEQTYVARWRSPLSRAPAVTLHLRQLRNIIATIASATSALHGTITVTAELLRLAGGPPAAPQTHHFALSGTPRSSATLLGKREVVLRLPSNSGADSSSDPIVDWEITLPVLPTTAVLGQESLDATHQKILATPSPLLPVVRLSLSLRPAHVTSGVSGSSLAAKLGQPEQNLSDTFMDIGTCIIDTSLLLHQTGGQWFTVATPASISCMLFVSYKHNFLSLRSPPANAAGALAMSSKAVSTTALQKLGSSGHMAARGGSGEVYVIGPGRGDGDDEDVMLHGWTAASLDLSSTQQQMQLLQADSGASLTKSSSSMQIADASSSQSFLVAGGPELSLEVCQARNITPVGGAVVSTAVVVGFAKETLSTAFAPACRHPNFFEGAVFRLSPADQLVNAVARIQLIERTSLGCIGVASVPIYKLLQEQTASVWVRLTAPPAVPASSPAAGVTSSDAAPVGEVLIQARVAHLLPLSQSNNGPSALLGDGGGAGSCSAVSFNVPQKILLRVIEASGLVVSAAASPLSATVAPSSVVPATNIAPYVSVYLNLVASATGTFFSSPSSVMTCVGETAPVPNTLHPVWAEELLIELIPSQQPLHIFVRDGSSNAPDASSALFGSCQISPIEIQKELRKQQCGGVTVLEIPLVNCDEKGEPSEKLSLALEQQKHGDTPSAKQALLGTIRVAILPHHHQHVVSANSLARTNIGHMGRSSSLNVSATIQIAHLRVYGHAAEQCLNSVVRAQQQAAQTADPGMQQPRGKSNSAKVAGRLIISTCDMELPTPVGGGGLQQRRRTHAIDISPCGATVSHAATARPGGAKDVVIAFAGLSPASLEVPVSVPSIASVQLCVPSRSNAANSENDMTVVAAGSFPLLGGGGLATTTTAAEGYFEHWVDLISSPLEQQQADASGVLGRVFIALTTVPIHGAPMATPTPGAPISPEAVPHVAGAPRSPAPSLDLKICLLELAGLLPGGNEQNNFKLRLQIVAMNLVMCSSQKNTTQQPLSWKCTTKGFVLPPSLSSSTSSSPSLLLDGLHESFSLVIPVAHPDGRLESSLSGVAAVDLAFRLFVEEDHHHHHRHRRSPPALLAAEGMLTVPLTAPPSKGAWIELAPRSFRGNPVSPVASKPGGPPKAHLRVAFEWLAASNSSSFANATMAYAAERLKSVMIYRVVCASAPIVAPVLAVTISFPAGPFQDTGLGRREVLTIPISSPARSSAPHQPFFFPLQRLFANLSLALLHQPWREGGSPIAGSPIVEAAELYSQPSNSCRIFLGSASSSSSSSSSSSQANQRAFSAINTFLAELAILVNASGASCSPSSTSSRGGFCETLEFFDGNVSSGHSIVLTNAVCDFSADSSLRSTKNREKKKHTKQDPLVVMTIQIHRANLSDAVAASQHWQFMASVSLPLTTQSICQVATAVLPGPPSPRSAPRRGQVELFWGQPHPKSATNRGDDSRGAVPSTMPTTSLVLPRLSFPLYLQEHQAAASIQFYSRSSSSSGQEPAHMGSASIVLAPLILASPEGSFSCPIVSSTSAAIGSVFGSYTIGLADPLRTQANGFRASVLGEKGSDLPGRIGDYSNDEYISDALLRQLLLPPDVKRQAAHGTPAGAKSTLQGRTASGEPTSSSSTCGSSSSAFGPEEHSLKNMLRSARLGFSVALEEVVGLPVPPPPPPESSTNVRVGRNASKKSVTILTDDAKPGNRRIPIPPAATYGGGAGVVIAQVHIPSLSAPIVLTGSTKSSTIGDVSATTSVDLSHSSTLQLQDTLLTGQDLLDRKFAASFWARVDLPDGNTRRGAMPRVMFLGVTASAGRAIYVPLRKAVLSGLKKFLKLIGAHQRRDKKRENLAAGNVVGGAADDEAARSEMTRPPQLTDVELQEFTVRVPLHTKRLAPAIAGGTHNRHQGLSDDASSGFAVFRIRPELLPVDAQVDQPSNSNGRKLVAFATMAIKPLCWSPSSTSLNASSSSYLLRIKATPSSSTSTSSVAVVDLPLRNGHVDRDALACLVGNRNDSDLRTCGPIELRCDDQQLLFTAELIRPAVGPPPLSVVPGDSELLTATDVAPSFGVVAAATISPVPANLNRIISEGSCAHDASASSFGDVVLTLVEPTGTATTGLLSVQFTYVIVCTPSTSSRRAFSSLLARRHRPDSLQGGSEKSLLRSVVDRSSSKLTLTAPPVSDPVGAKKQKLKDVGRSSLSTCSSARAEDVGPVEGRVAPTRCIAMHIKPSASSDGNNRKQQAVEGGIGSTLSVIETAESVEVIAIGGCRSSERSHCSAPRRISSRLLSIRELKWRPASSSSSSSSSSLLKSTNSPSSPLAVFAREGHASVVIDAIEMGNSMRALHGGSVIVVDGGFGRCPGALDVTLGDVAGTYEDRHSIYRIGDDSLLAGACPSHYPHLSSAHSLSSGGAATPANISSIHPAGSTSGTVIPKRHESKIASLATTPGKATPSNETTSEGQISASSAVPEGSVGGGGYLNQTCLFDPIAGTWSRLALSGSKDYRCDHSLVYCRRDRLVVAFGGWGVRVEEKVILSNRNRSNAEQKNEGDTNHDDVDDDDDPSIFLPAERVNVQPETPPQQILTPPAGDPAGASAARRRGPKRRKQTRCFAVVEEIQNDVRCLDLRAKEWTTLPEITHTAANTNTWTFPGSSWGPHRIATITAAPRLAAHAASLIRDRFMFVFGGLTTRRGPLQKVAPDTLIMSRASNVSQRSEPTDGEEYASGGQGEDLVPSAELYVLDLLTLQWGLVLHGSSVRLAPAPTDSGKRRDEDAAGGYPGISLESPPVWPSARYGHSMAYVPHTGNLLLVGTHDSATAEGDYMYCLNVAALLWTPVVLSGGTPFVPRFRPQLCYVPVALNAQAAGITAHGTFVISGGTLPVVQHEEESSSSIPCEGGSDSRDHRRRVVCLRRKKLFGSVRLGVMLQPGMASLADVAVAIDGF
jgi:hypothetical protein